MSSPPDDSRNSRDLLEPRVTLTRRKRLWRRYRVVWLSLLCGTATAGGSGLAKWCFELLSQM